MGKASNDEDALHHKQNERFMNWCDKNYLYLKLKPLANAHSLTVFQSNQILSLLTTITFYPPVPSKLTSTNNMQMISNSVVFLLSPVPLPTSSCSYCAPECTYICVCGCAAVVCQEYNIMFIYYF